LRDRRQKYLTCFAVVVQDETISSFFLPCEFWLCLRICFQTLQFVCSVFGPCDGPSISIEVPNQIEGCRKDVHHDQTRWGSGASVVNLNVSCCCEHVETTSDLPCCHLRAPSPYYVPREASWETSSADSNKRGTSYVP
jgi:hypothetical protein